MCVLKTLLLQPFYCNGKAGIEKVQRADIHFRLACKRHRRGIDNSNNCTKGLQYPPELTNKGFDVMVLRYLGIATALSQSEMSICHIYG